MKLSPPEAVLLVQLDIQAQIAYIREPDAPHFSPGRALQGSGKSFVL
jgi:hypothetical protein